jgi:molecular chaperone DnaK
MEKLNTSFQAASQDMYQSTNGDPSADKGEEPKSDNKSKSDEEVTDVDFEEV